MAVVAAGAQAKAAHDANSAAKAGYKHAKGEAAAQRYADEQAIKAAQRSPAAMFAPIMMGFATDVFGKAFAKHGFQLPADQIKRAMGLDRIVRNNAEGLPWNFNDEQYENEKTKQAQIQQRARMWGGGVEGSGGGEGRFGEVSGFTDRREAGFGGGGTGVYSDAYTERAVAAYDDPRLNNEPSTPATYYQSPIGPGQNQNLQPMVPDESQYANAARGL
jgi:hypothetical protein